MAEHCLRAGTVLDERYRIDAVLGEGGFGITYRAVNRRIDMQVAVKELYWRDHCCRDIEEGMQVHPLEESDAALFAEQKDRFLREARVVRDFSQETGIAHILDYFEANGTAYIVMEFVHGTTLNDIIRREGRMNAQTAFEKMLPLVESLSHIHKGGVIHRDISPDNIMVQNDGSLKLIDFGAARLYRKEEKSYTTVTKDSYCPPEQYDRHGVQGPWTDVYALCASMYYAVTGLAPESAIQRLFLDELVPPSQTGADVPPGFEAVLLKGLSMSGEERYRDMEALHSAMDALLPKPEKKVVQKWPFVLLALVIALTAAAAGRMAWVRYQRDNRFAGVEMERFELYAPENITAVDFAGAQKSLEEVLDAKAGEDNYILTADQASLTFSVSMPLSSFADRPIDDWIKSVKFYEPGGFTYWAEVQGIWEDPHGSILAGEYQVAPSELTGETIVLSYTTYTSSSLSRGQRVSVNLDFKTRLDALQVPYAFGMLYGDQDGFVIRISPEVLNSYFVNALGMKYYQVCGSGNYPGFTINDRLVELVGEGNDVHLRLTLSGYDLEKVGSSYSSAEDECLYIVSDNYSGPIGAMVYTDMADIEDGVLDFTGSLLTEECDTPENRAAMSRFLYAVISQTELPVTYTFTSYSSLNADGDTVFQTAHLGLKLDERSCETAQKAAIEEIAALFGVKAQYPNNDSHTVKMSISAEPDAFVAAVETQLLPMVSEKALQNSLGRYSIMISLCDTAGEKWGEVYISNAYRTSFDGAKHSVTMYCSDDLSEIKTWWSELDLSAYSCEKGN